MGSVTENMQNSGIGEAHTPSASLVMADSLVSGRKLA